MATTQQLQDNGMAQAWAALVEVDWLPVIGSTLALTGLAACVAASLPPLQLLVWPGRSARWIHKCIWLMLRLLPAPLTALLLLMLAQPSLALAALALGLHHGGVMGRVFADQLSGRDLNRATALLQTGAGQRISWLYGPLAEISRSYLAYATYRLDVILRDTATVGLVGGAGLGWELIEAISSFHGWLVIWLVVVYALLTLIGESLSERVLQTWNCKAVPL